MRLRNNKIIKHEPSNSNRNRIKTSLKKRIDDLNSNQTVHENFAEFLEDSTCQNISENREIYLRHHDSLFGIASDLLFKHDNDDLKRFQNRAIRSTHVHKLLSITKKYITETDFTSHAHSITKLAEFSHFYLKELSNILLKRFCIQARQRMLQTSSIADYLVILHAAFYNKPAKRIRKHSITIVEPSQTNLENSHLDLISLKPLLPAAEVLSFFNDHLVTKNEQHDKRVNKYEYAEVNTIFLESPLYRYLKNLENDENLSNILLKIESQHYVTSTGQTTTYLLNSDEFNPFFKRLTHDVFSICKIISTDLFKGSQ